MPRRRVNKVYQSVIQIKLTEPHGKNLNSVGSGWSDRTEDITSKLKKKKKIQSKKLHRASQWLPVGHPHSIFVSRWKQDPGSSLTRFLSEERLLHDPERCHAGFPSRGPF